MTGLLHEKEFSRKTFLKGSGGMVIGFSLAGAGLASKAQADISPFSTGNASNVPADVSPFASTPLALLSVDSFIAIHPDNTASIMTGGGEHGAGTSTGWLQVAGEELDMDMSQLQFVDVDTQLGPPVNVATYASQGMKLIGPQVRAAAAHAKQALLGLASTQLGVPAANLTVKSGIVSGGGKSVTYGELIGDKLFNVQMPVGTSLSAPGGTQAVFSGNPKTVPLNGGPPVATAIPAPFVASLDQGVGPTKPVSEYTLVQTRVPRIDIPDIVTGQRTYIQNVFVPGMLHGRIVFPRGQASYGFGAPVVSVDESSISHIPGARVVQKGDFIGVVAPMEWDAIQAAAQLKVQWVDPPQISGDGDLWTKMRSDRAAGLTQTVNVLANIGNVDEALASAANVVSQTYTYQYRMHAPIGPGCSIADVTPNGALVMTFTQASARMYLGIADLLDLPLSAVRIKVYPGSSAYGEAFGRYEVPMAAAIMSSLAGAPVRVQAMRWDEHGWEPYGPATMTDISGSMDASGNIVALDYTSLQPWALETWITQQMIGTPMQAPSSVEASDDADGEAYNIPNRRNTSLAVPQLGGYIKTGKKRSTTQPAGFATEVFIDELAHAADMDPIAFRMQNLSQNPVYYDREVAALEALVQASNWQPKVAASDVSSDTVVTGRGVAFSPRKEPPLVSFSGAIAEIQLHKKTGKITVTHVYAVQDQGLAVNPALIENQIIGQVVQATSEAMEAVRYNTSRVTSLDWVSYPILRFKDAPKVTPLVINNPNIIMSGAGDYVGTQVVPAIANAFFDATGVRIRQVPMSSGVVLAVLKAAGVA